MHLCIRTYIYIYMHLYIRTHIHVYVHIYIHAYVHVITVFQYLIGFPQKEKLRKREFLIPGILKILKNSLENIRFRIFFLKGSFTDVFLGTSERLICRILRPGKLMRLKEILVLFRVFRGLLGNLKIIKYSKEDC